MNLSKKPIKSHKEKEISFWSKYSKFYPHLEDARPYYKLVDTIESFINPKQGETWLDAGCGPGTMMDLIKNKSNNKIKKIIGIDIDKKMLWYAKKRFEKEEAILVEFHNIDLSNKTFFKNQEFDGIIANLVLTYINTFEEKKNVEALKGVFGEMYRIMKTGGSLVWSTPIKGVNFIWVFLASWREILDPRHPKRLYAGPAILRYALSIQKKGKKGIYNFFSKEQIEKILEEIGFKGIEFKRSFANQVWVIKAHK